MHVTDHTYLVVMDSIRELFSERALVEQSVWGTVNDTVVWPLWHPVKDAIREELS